MRMILWSLVLGTGSIAGATPRDDVFQHALTCGTSVLHFDGADSNVATLDGRPISVTWDDQGATAKVDGRDLSREDDTFILGDDVCTID